MMIPLSRLPLIFPTGTEPPRTIAVLIPLVVGEVGANRRHSDCAFGTAPGAGR
jgi:hypothetical protein